MGTLNAILGAATSGLYAAQTQLKVVSDNIANVDTAGYSAETVQQTPLAGGSGTGGVQVSQISLVVNQFLQQASLSAASQSGSANAMSNMLDEAQDLFGDPSSKTSYFTQLEQTFSDITSAIQSPASSVPRDQVVADVQSFLSQSSSISSGLQQLSNQADSQISDGVSQVNTLLSQIYQLNQSIAGETASGGSAAGSQNAQASLVTQLSSLLNVNVSSTSNGGVEIRTGSGALLVGGGGAATLSYATSGTTAGQLQLAQPGGGTAQTLIANGGSLQGLLTMRNQQLPAISSQLDQYVSQAVDQINRAHNASTSVPPPTTLTGANVGTDLATAISGFTGQTTIGLVDSSGAVQASVDIDFDNDTIDGTGFTPSTFLSVLNGELGPNGSASFNNGVLSISGSNGYGVAIGDDQSDPTDKAGRSFSDFFGLNDLISSSTYTNTDTGLQSTDPNGFDAGGTITLRLQNTSGATLRIAQVTIPSGGTMSDVVTALNSSQTGVGMYGSYSLDSEGQLTFTPSQQGVSATVVGDNTQWGSGGASLSQLFGLSSANQTPLAQSYSVRSDIASNSAYLALAEYDPTSSQLSIGDTSGGQLLAAVNSQTVQFSAAGAAGAASTTLSNYASQFAGSIAQQASQADNNNTNAQSIATEASNRLSSADGVSLDQELVNMTTYQQAYNANARLLQAVSQLYQTLMNIQ